MIVREKCELCRCEDAAAFEKYERWPHLDIVKCVGCGFVFTKQIPDDKEIAELYDDFFDLQDSDRDLQAADKDRALQKQAANQQILAAITEYAMGDNLLEVGCYLGSFLDAARLAGFSTAGNDLSRKYVEYVKGKGHPARVGQLEEVNFQDQEFDVVVMQEVFEHLRYPMKILDELRRILKHNGVLVLEVPNLSFQFIKGRIEKSGVYRSLINRPVRGLRPDFHLSHFTVDTLTKMLAEKGFTVRKVSLRKSTASRTRHSSAMILLLRTWISLATALFRVCGMHLGNAIIVIATKY